MSSFRADYFFSAGFIAAVLLMLALVVSAIVLAIAVVRSGSGGDAPWPKIVGLAVAALFVSTVFGVDPAIGSEVSGMALLSAAFYLAAVRFGDRDRVTAILTAYLSIGLLACILAIVMNLLRVPLDVWVFNHGRATGVFATANYFGAFLVLLIVTAAGTAVARPGRLRLLSAVVAVVACAALVLSYSRSAQIGTLAGIAAFLWWLGRRRWAWFAVAVLIVAAAASFALPDVHHDPSENFSRWAIWKTGVRVALLFPLTGVGPMGYHTIYPAVAPIVAEPAAAQGYLQPHNVVLSLWGDLGTAGLGAVTFAAVLFVREMRRALARSDRSSRILALALCAALAGTLAQGMFDLVGPPELVFVWIPFAGLAAAAARAGNA